MVLTRLIIAAIVVFILFNLGRSIWRNWQTSQKISTIEEEIGQLENQNQHLNNLIVYYQTDSFKELEARRKLGYKKTGENVLVIPELVQTEQNEDQIPQSSKEKVTTPKTANFIKWYQYVMGK